MTQLIRNHQTRSLVIQKWRTGHNDKQGWDWAFVGLEVTNWT